MAIGLGLASFGRRVQRVIRDTYFPLNGPKGYDKNNDGKDDYWRVFSENQRL